MFSSHQEHNNVSVSIVICKNTVTTWIQGSFISTEGGFQASLQYDKSAESH